MKSSQKYIILLSSLLLLFTLGMSYVWVDNDRAVSAAASYVDLAIAVQTEEGEELLISPWEEEGIYYYFLPAMTSAENVYFRNIGENASLLLNDTVVTNNTRFLDSISPEEMLSLQMTIDDTALEQVNVCFLCSSNLPAVFLELDEEAFAAMQTDKTMKTSAHMRLYTIDGKKEYSSQLEYIRTRGNSTLLSTEKKSFQMKLLHEEGLLGMDSALKWNLMANYFDRSFMRNDLVNSFALEHTELIGQEGEFTDLYINGKYYGLFYLCEKREVDKNRVNIQNLEERNKELNGTLEENGLQYVSEDDKIHATNGKRNPDDITGGYLIETSDSNEHAQEICSFRTNSGKYYRVISPNNATKEQVEYICQLFDEMENAFEQEDGICTVSGKHYSEYINVQSWVDKYVIDETFQNTDGAGEGVCFYKDSDEVNPLIQAGPVWDYDRAMGNYGVASHSFWDYPTNLLYCSPYAVDWMQRSEIQKMAAQSFERLFDDKNVAGVIADIYAIENKIEASAYMDYIRWDSEEGYYKDFKANCDYLIYFLQAKVAYLNDTWINSEEYHTVTFLDYEGNICARYFVKSGEYLPESPVVTSYAGLFAGWYSENTGKELEITMPVLEDVTYISRWIDIGLLALNDLALNEIDVQQLNFEEIRNYIDILEKMKESKHD